VEGQTGGEFVAESWTFGISCSAKLRRFRKSNFRLRPFRNLQERGSRFFPRGDSERILRTAARTFTGESCSDASISALRMTGAFARLLRSEAAVARGHGETVFFPDGGVKYPSIYSG